MKKLKALILALFISSGSTSLFAQGYPVLDVANLMQSIEAVYQYYQQIQNTIEQVKNTYTQIEQAATQMANMNWDDLQNLKDNFQNVSDNPFEVISGVRNSAQDIVKAVNKNMNKVNNFKDSLDNKSISFGGHKVSMSDLCGFGAKEDNLLGFTKSCWDYTVEQAEEVAAGYEGQLTYQERQAIMRKYGMSPRNYASMEYTNYMTRSIFEDAGVKSNEEYLTQQVKEIYEGDAYINKVIASTGDGQMYAQGQITNSLIAGLDKDIRLLCLNMESGWDAIITTEKTKASQERARIKEDKEAYKEEKEKLKKQNYTDFSLKRY